MAIKVLDADRDFIAVTPAPGVRVRYIVHPGVGARHAVMTLIEMDPGSEDVPHRHPVAEDVLYVVEGEGVAVDLDLGVEWPVEAGCVISVEPGTRHTIRATGAGRLVLLGGPCPPEREVLERLGVLAGGAVP